MAEAGNDSEGPEVNIEEWVRKLAETRPGVVKTRMLSALEHFERSEKLFQIDREMASFRAINGLDGGHGDRIPELPIGLGVRNRNVPTPLATLEAHQPGALGWG